MPFEKKPVEDYDYPDDKQEDRDPVNTVHSPDIAIARCIRIFLFDV